MDRFFQDVQSRLYMIVQFLMAFCWVQWTFKSNNNPLWISRFSLKGISLQRQGVLRNITPSSRMDIHMKHRQLSPRTLPTFHRKTGPPRCQLWSDCLHMPGRGCIPPGSPLYHPQTNHAVCAQMCETNPLTASTCSWAPSWHQVC